MTPEEIRATVENMSHSELVWLVVELTQSEAELRKELDEKNGIIR